MADFYWRVQYLHTPTHALLLHDVHTCIHQSIHIEHDGGVICVDLQNLGKNFIKPAAIFCT